MKIIYITLVLVSFIILVCNSFKWNLHSSKLSLFISNNNKNNKNNNERIITKNKSFILFGRPKKVY